MNIRKLIRESILQQVALIEEATKDRFVLANRYLSNEEKQEIIDLLKKKPHIEDQILKMIKNWNRFKEYSYEDLKPALEYVSHTEKKQEVKVKGAEVLFENNQAFVIKPLTKDASICYGKGTKWCTAAMSGNMFNAYFGRSKVTLIYVINKNSDPLYDDYAKMAIAIYPSGEKEVFDAKDNSERHGFYVEHFLKKTKKLDIPEDIFQWHEDIEARKSLEALNDAIQQNNYDLAKSLLDSEDYPVTETTVELAIMNYSRTKERDIYDMIIGQVDFRRGILTPKIEHAYITYLPNDTSVIFPIHYSLLIPI